MNLKKLHSIVIVLFSTYLIVSCVGLDTRNLGSDYYLIESGASGVISKKVEGKKGVYTDIIIGEIKDFSFNEEFIVIYREVTDESSVYFKDHELWTESNNSIKNQFWIINKEESFVYGPLDFEKYVILKDSLNIDLQICI